METKPIRAWLGTPFAEFPEETKAFVTEKMFPLFEGKSLEEVGHILRCMDSALDEATDAAIATQPFNPDCIPSPAQDAAEG
jgi:hypothetical protein